MNATLKVKEIVIVSNPRKDFSGVDALAASIEKIGLLQPIAVREEKVDGPGRRIILVDGEQRLRAFNKLKREDIPVFFVTTMDLQEAKEASLMANLMRSDLSLVERMRGFVMLLENAPAKYNELVIANKFGLKERDVKNMVATIRKIDPKVDVDLCGPEMDTENVAALAIVPMQYQRQVVDHAKKKRLLDNMQWAIQEQTVELFFDDVFKESSARAAGKVHYKRNTYSNPRTFDKAFAAEVKTEFEARTKKKYADEKNKASKQAELSVGQKKKKQEKEKAEKTQALTNLRGAVEATIGKSRPEKEVRNILEDQLRRLNTEPLRLLLRAFAVEFKASQNSTDDLRKLVAKNVFGNIKTSEQIVSVIAIINTASHDQDAKKWADAIRKNI